MTDSATVATAPAMTSRRIILLSAGAITVTLIIAIVSLTLARDFLFERIASDAGRRWASLAASVIESDAAANPEDMQVPAQAQASLSNEMSRGGIGHFALFDRDGTLTSSTRIEEIGGRLPPEILRRLGSPGGAVLTIDPISGTALPRGVVFAMAPIQASNSPFGFVGVEVDRQEVSADLFRMGVIGVAAFGAILILVMLPSTVFMVRHNDERTRREAELKAAYDRLAEQTARLEKLTAELGEARDRADRGNAAKSTFLAMISHELRTPLTAILGLGELLLHSKLDDEQRKLAQTMNRSATLFVGLINDILDFSKIEAGKIDLVSVDFSPARVIAEVRNLLAPAVSAAGNRLAADIGGDVPTVVVGDPSRYRQIVLNLVGNANKFTNNGVITIALRHRELASEGLIEIQTRVTDTGKGISEADQKLLFERFSQVGDSARTTTGTGLGLAISKQLAEAMGGTISVWSAVGEGSAFTFTIKVKRAAENAVLAPTPSLATADPAASMRPLRILVAEDNEAIRMLLQARLERMGHDVRAVENGQEAIDAAASDRFDIALMDMQMPVVDGITATATILATQRSRELPILALTADALVAHHEAYLKAGARRVMTKPVDWSQLSQALDEFTAGRTAAQPPDSDITPAIDTAFMEGFAEGLDPQLVERLLHSFLTESTLQLQNLGDALMAGDLEAAKRAAHAIKGASSQFGAARVERLARAIEVQSASLTEAQKHMPELREAWDEVRRDIKRKLDGIHA